MSNASYSFLLGCDTQGYDVHVENLKYAVQFVYLLLGAIVHIRCLMVILFYQRKFYLSQSFFIIFVMDSIASLTQILLDISMNRPTIYIPQLCPILFDAIGEHPFFPHLGYTLYSYMRAAKSITQIFSTLNRMTCVMMPFEYGQIWRRLTPVAIATITFSPFLVIWNVMISDVFPAGTFAGFTLGYKKRVKWASLSLFQMTFMLISLFITIVTTTVTLFKMSRLENRLKSSEKTLCFASFYISGGFFFAALFQSYFVFFNVAAAGTDLVYFLQGLSFDVLNVGGPIVMILISSQLRFHVIPSQKLAPKVSTVISITNLSKV